MVMQPNCTDDLDDVACCMPLNLMRPENYSPLYSTRSGDLDELKLAKPGAVTKDVAYIEDLMREIERSSIPAHAPIEQRWTGGSGAPMSPAAGPPGSVHSWVGVIMYLPTEEDSQRREITEVCFPK